MTTVARNVDRERRRAWRRYADRLEGLEGPEYVRAEEEAWAELQAALRDLRDEPHPGDAPLG